jgi:two-component system NtrC family sensor kinase
MTEDRTLGILTLDHPEKDHFHQRHLFLILAIAHQAALAIEKARLHKEVSHMAEVLAQRVEERTRELRETQVQLIQAEKLAALGRMAASIAHEVNNPLQAIQNCLHLVINRPLTEDKQAYYLQMAQEEVQRLITIVTRTLDFYRPSKGRVAPIQVNRIVESVLALAGKRLEQGKVRVSRHLAELPEIPAVPDQVTQVFLNLVINAVEAMPGGGTLRIGTALDREGYVRVSFTDSGEGLKQEDVDKLFEPFFTTKASGTGLGLAVSHNIVERHGGHILVDSAPGQGATFTVVLPIEASRQEI